MGAVRDIVLEHAQRRGMSSARNRMILAARGLGIEDALRDVHALRSREGRRDRRDMRACGA